MDFRIYNLDNSASGCWYVIHFLAANGERKALKTLLKTFEKRFMCPKCRFHIRKYLSENPLPSKDSDPWILFLWTTHFHNAVNIRLNKPIFSEIGEIELFKQLTTIADEDGEKYEEQLKNGKGEDEIQCEGCTSTSAAAPLLRYSSSVPTNSSSSFDRNNNSKNANDLLLEELSRKEWPISKIQFV